jgi:L-lactate dehydrogenase complex protein LldF
MHVDPDFPKLSARALQDKSLGAALDTVAGVMPLIRSQALTQLDDFAAARERAREVRDEALNRLDHYLEEFERNVLAMGGHVHWARDDHEACAIVAQLCADVDAKLVTKSKSMVTEEIELAAALEARGLEVVETDLGEYIIQLRGEKPSHILAPALHVTIPQVIESFNTHHQIKRDRPLEDTDQLLAEARAVLREKFLNADVGITGANFLIAETGGVVIVTNEGNADLTASLPDTHIVVTGIEKVVPSMDDASLMLRLLARSAIGQRLSNYTSFIHGPRRASDAAGPGSFHVVLVDNGRSDMLGSELQDMLRCIRCSACINHCPVYTAIGGHAYGSVYPGPMGAVLTPGLADLDSARHLPNASTFCGRCEEVCPVAIPIPKLLRHWRTREFARHLRPSGERYGLSLWAWLNQHLTIYRLAQRIGAMFLGFYARTEPDGQWIEHLPGAAAGWTVSRDLPAPAKRSFQAQWRKRGRSAAA